MPLIQTKNICKTYASSDVATRAVCEVNLVIEKGEFVAIMGPSGSGKSTLMQLLGFLDRPTAGEYFFEGKNIQNFSDDELATIRNEKIGFIFQSFNLLTRTTVYGNVELPLLYSRKKGNLVRHQEKVMSALKSVMMEHRANYYSNQLSGGEKQRVAIARALVNNPEVIFADEPTGNLDSKSGLQVMSILRKLNNLGHTIILVTHETFTAEYAHRILQMSDGHLVSDSPVADRLQAVDMARKLVEKGEFLK